MRLKLVGLLAVSLTCLNVTASLADEVVVFAAASMKTALDQLAQDFSETTDHTAVISYAGSNVLAKQIIEGAPANIFISAAENWMDAVQDAGLIVPGQRQDLLGNSLVLISGDLEQPDVDLQSGFDFAALFANGHVAMGMVDAVPAGQYGKAAFTQMGAWSAVEPLVVQSDNVRAAMNLVALGEADYGVVYATDAAAEPKVKVVGTFPADSHPAIILPVAQIKGDENPAAEAFYQALSSPKAVEIFIQAGFSVLDNQ